MTGKLTWNLSGIVSLCAMLVAFCPAQAAAQTQALPKGPYQSNCTDAGMAKYYDGAPLLTASCTNYYGQYQPASLPAPESCPTVDTPQGKIQQIYNVNGALRCNFKPAKQDPSGHANWDWIGKTTWTDDAKSIQKTYWTVDQPNIANPFTPYPDISYQAGDTLVLNAGGCAQSGGSGNTWKRYLDPNGSSSGPPGGEYFGLALLPGTGAPKFDPPNSPPAILDMANRYWTVYPNPDSPHQVLSLTLGYVDDGYPNSLNGYGDNGYYSHDDGDNGQCSSSVPNSYADGPAWVTLEVEHPLKPVPLPYSAGSKPFDIVFNQIDANGLPMNPEWYWDLHPASPLAPATNDPFLAEETLHVPDFNVRCGPAFSTRGTSTGGDVVADIFLGPFASGLVDGEDASTQVDSSKLASVCTSQPAAVDQYYAFDNASSLVLSNVPGICGADPIRGHLNWEPVTYSGSLHFSDWSGVFPEDDDINMSLVAGTAGKTGLLWGQTVGSVQMGKSSGSENYPYGGFLIEFDASETVWKYFSNLPAGTFWHAFATAAQASGPGNPAFAASQPSLSDFSSGINAANELMVAAKSAADAESTSNLSVDAVVTGLMGIDGAHSGGISELHPVFSLAVHEIGKDEPSPTGKTEHWAFFIRNQGDEGSCSNQMHTWEPEEYGARDYYISLPWPHDEGKPDFDKVDPSIQAVPWVDGSSIAKTQASPGVGTFVHFLSPPYSGTSAVPFFGYDGEITLQYTYAKSSDQKKDSQDPKDNAKAPVAHDDSHPAAKTGAEDVNNINKDEKKDEKAESNDAEDFPWRKMIAASKDPAVTAHLKKYFTTSTATVAGAPRPVVTEHSGVDLVGPRRLPRDARLPHRTHELADATRQRSMDELRREEGSPHQVFQALDSQHVFFIGTDGDLHYTQGPFNSSASNTDKPSNASKLVDHDVMTFAAVSASEVLTLEQNRALYIQTAPFDVASDGTCKKGYVWRAAYPQDHVCVTPSRRDGVAAENAAASSRASRSSFDKADACLPGYVWRQASPSDHVCVPPDVRAQTAEENKLGPSRVASASGKKFFGWPVSKYQATSYGDILVLDKNGKLLSFSPPFDSSSKPKPVAEKVRAFQGINPAHTLVLTTDDRLRSYPIPTGSAAAKPYDNVWSFQQAGDGSLFIIDGDDTLWSEQPLKQLDTKVRKVYAINAGAVFILNQDGTLSLVKPAAAAAQSNVKTSIASNVRDFQVMDAQTVFVLDTEGKLWLEQGNFGSGTVTKSLVADKVR